MNLTWNIDGEEIEVEFDITVEKETRQTYNCGGEPGGTYIDILSDVPESEIEAIEDYIINNLDYWGL